jgi:predicted AlkP superfamily phosphohydrolase/phosphomutase
MKDNRQLQAVKDSLTERARFYINSPERAAEGIVFINQIKKLVKRLEDSIKPRAEEKIANTDTGNVIHQMIDLDTGEVFEFDVSMRQPSTAIALDPKTVYDVLGEDAFKFMTVKSTLMTALKKQSAIQNSPITMKHVEAVQENATETVRKGHLVVRQLKD